MLPVCPLVFHAPNCNPTPPSCIRAIPPRSVLAEFSLETNAPPAGGHLESDLLSVTAGVDELLLLSLGWTDDVDDLPLTHSRLDICTVTRDKPRSEGDADYNIHTMGLRPFALCL